MLSNIKGQEDFVAPNASCVPKPTTKPSTNPDDLIHNIEIEISSDESGDEYESDDFELSFLFWKYFSPTNDLACSKLIILNLMN